MIDKGITILEGDFFSYGSVFFEVIQAPDSNTIYGEIEHKSFMTIIGKQARKGQFDATSFWTQQTKAILIQTQCPKRIRSAERL